MRCGNQKQKICCYLGHRFCCLVMFHSTDTFWKLDRFAFMICDRCHSFWNNWIDVQWLFRIISGLFRWYWILNVCWFVLTFCCMFVWTLLNILEERIACLNRLNLIEQIIVNGCLKIWIFSNWTSNHHYR